MRTTKRPSRDHGTPKYPWVKERIHNEIIEGRYPPGLRLPTETEWARKLKVTAPTISRALNELESSGLIVRRRGSGSYVADPRKRQVLPGRNLHLGVLYSVSATPAVLWNSFLGRVLEGFLQELGMDDVPVACPAVQEDQDTRMLWQSKDHNVAIECLGEARLSHARHPSLSAVKAGEFDGLVTVSVVEDDWLREVLGLGIPTVLTDYAGSDDELEADVVYLDPSSGYRRAARHFYSQGCRRMHFIGSLMSAPTPKEKELMTDQEWRSGWSSRKRVDPDSHLRLNAFRNGMEECGISLEDHAIHFIQGTPARMQELGSHLAGLPDDQRPDALACHQIDQAEMLLDFFARRNLPLQAAGTALNISGTRALPILADGRNLGSVAAELLTSRLARPQRPHMRVGVKMRFHEISNGRHQ